MKAIFTVIVLLALSLSLSAEECNRLETLPSVPSWIHPLSYTGATEGLIAKAACTKSKAPTIKEIEAYFENKYAAKNGSESFQGMSFSSEAPEMIELMKKLTVIPPRSTGCFNCKGQSQQKNYSLPPGCSSALCAARSLFGNEQGPRMLYLLDRFGFNSSPEIYPNAVVWDTKNLDVVIKSLEDLPDSLFPMNNRQLTRNPTGGAGANDVGNSFIEFFHRFTTLPVELRRYAVTHEWGHVIAANKNLDMIPAWLNISGWVSRGEDWSVSEPQSVVSRYGQTNPHEDFAESVATYRYNPKLLMKVSPEKYRYIQENVYDGVEFTSEAACQGR